MALIFSSAVYEQIGLPSGVRDAGGIPVIANLTGLGVLEGRFDRFTKVSRFFGVPFAQPPVGALRWQAPQTVQPWSGVLQATTSYPCAQAAGAPSFRGVEDCLYADFIVPYGGIPSVPATPTPGTYPFQVWVHGGGMAQESFPLYTVYDSFYAANDISYLPNSGKAISVLAHYRMDMLGFMSHPALKETSLTSYYGNYGLLDLVQLLSFINTYGSGFGGNTARVTINGESAGATLVGALVASPLTNGLITGAIGQSIWNLNGGAPFSQTLRDELGSLVVAGSGCGGYDSDTAADSTQLTSIAGCLRAMSPMQILGAQYAADTASWDAAHGGSGTYMLLAFWQVWQAYPVIDGYALPSPPLDLLAAGACLGCTILYGENADEASYITTSASTDPGGTGSSVTALWDFGAFYATLSITSGASTTTAAQYMASASSYGGFSAISDYFSAIVDPYQRYNVASTSGYFSSNIGMMLDTLSTQSGRAPATTHRYVFADGTATGPFLPTWGAFHTTDLNYVWGYYMMDRNFMTDVLLPLQGYGTPAGFDMYWSDAQIALGDTMHKYWSAIITTGGPNAAGDSLPTWEPYTATSGNTMLFKSEIPGGAALNPCAMLYSCMPEPLFNFRKNVQAFFSSGYSSSAAPIATCSTPVIGYSHAEPATYAANCSIAISAYPGALPCCQYARSRQLLFGSASGATCRTC